MDKTIIVLTTVAYKAGQRKGCDAWELAGGRAKLSPSRWRPRRNEGSYGGCARFGEKEKKADFLVDYKRFTPRVTKAFTEGDIVHPRGGRRSKSLSRRWYKRVFNYPVRWPLRGLPISLSSAVGFRPAISLVYFIR